MQLSRLNNEQLLALRFCDLKISIKGSKMEEYINQLYSELEAKGLRFRPHFWIGKEWFAADGVPGIAVPFYLIHNRLRRLEQSMMLEVEGGTKSECMRILRHETGHAIDFAYRLHNQRRWREVFGRYSDPYPESYRPRPHSKRYVLHLDDWYAQAHPAEDFAETFAVWMTPRLNWRSRYKGWPALKKLQFVDELMKEIGSKPPLVKSREKVEPISDSRQTLQTHYKKKCDQYGVGLPDFADRHLYKLFSDDPQWKKNSPADAFIRKHRKDFRDYVSNWTGTSAYTLDQVLNRLSVRSKELNLRLRLSERDTKRHFFVLLTMLTMSYIYSDGIRVSM